MICGVLVAVCFSGPAAARDDLLLVFAGCAGRISAEMEHAWLLRDGRADALEGQRRRFVSLLEAIMPPDRAREVLSRRVEVKLAHAATLTTASFGTNLRMSELARHQAARQVQSCQTMLLDG